VNRPDISLPPESSFVIYPSSSAYPFTFSSYTLDPCQISEDYRLTMLLRRTISVVITQAASSDLSPTGNFRSNGNLFLGREMG
jgi:hypothetical protein